MKKTLKILLIIVGLIGLFFLVAIIATALFYTGDSEFTQTIVGTWKTTGLDTTYQFDIYKGSRAAQGYTYGYFDAVGFEKHSYHIRYKDNALEFPEKDADQSLSYSPEDDQLSGYIYLPDEKESQLTFVVLKRVQ